jgi:starch phosphorylase
MAVRSLRTFTVLPHLPDRLQALQKLAYNVWWCWNQEAISLFRRIDDDLFESLGNSPVKTLGATSQVRLHELEEDEGFLAHMDRVAAALNDYLANPSTWFHEHYPKSGKFRIAYFSAEFGLHESIPIYSGGLGLLAGDHLKAASDLGVPLVGVGLMYREGYFRQYLNADGWQQESYPENDFFNLPLIQECDGKGEPLLISVAFPGRDVWCRIWRIQVGRVPLYLLDTNIARNSEEDRQITYRLYGGDNDMRVRQEMILGIGGIRALRALNQHPTICHMNEGHSAFCGLERIRLIMEETHCDYATAREVVSAGACFTTHTPVPAGNDMFPAQLVEHYLGTYYPQLGIDRTEFLGLGRQNPRDEQELFCMTVLAIRLANTTNGVSQLHGSVSRKMWKNIWPEVPESELPITAITNGVHTPSWLSPEMTQLYDRYLGLEWAGRPADSSVWRRLDQIPDAELWRTHERRRERLVAFARRRLRDQLKRRGAPAAEIGRADEALDPEALTIGFARRFATYKRGSLIFRNMERLISLLSNKEKPVQLIFAGKAHPRDHGGKELIAEILHTARRPELRRRIVFIEDYDINVARYLVQGVDVWLNNPRRPLEASGTSGMKVCGNGGINLSVLDGWWVEGYKQGNGWAIGAGEEYSDLAYQDEVESRSIYELIEQEIIPLFYARSSDGLPRGWLRAMKESMKMGTSFFNTHRMVGEYVSRCYWPSERRYDGLIADNLQRAQSLAQWRKRERKEWPQLKIDGVEPASVDFAHVGGSLQVKARVHLANLTPDDVAVQLFHGLVDSFGEIPSPATVDMTSSGKVDGNFWQYSGQIPFLASGQHGFAVRILPKNADLANSYEPGLICWG